MTRFVRSGGGRDAVGRAARNYVGARGGARGSAQAATSGRRSTTRLGGFLSSVATRGVGAAARDLGLGDLTGRAASAVFAEIADRLAPDGATLEEAAARRAVNEALFLLYDRYDLTDGDLTRLDSMDANAVRDAIQASVTCYIYYRWLQELGDRIERNAVSPEQAVQLEREVRQYVEDAVRLDLADVDVLNLQWGGPQGSQFIDRIYREAYDLLE